jgi:plastocyanin
MKTKLRVCAAGVVLVIAMGCGRDASDQETTELPPVAQAPEETTTDGYQVSAVTDGGGIAGTIALSGPIPDSTVRPSAAGDPPECGTGDRGSERFIVDNNGGLRDVVVIVEGVTRGKAMPAIAQNAELDQRNCEYTPNLTVMVVDTEISVQNSDPLLHNIQFYLGDDTLFNIAQPVQGQVNERLIENVGVIDVECAVHGWMQASVVVVDNPYYAVTDENGQFSIPDLPPGTYQVKIWHKYLGEESLEVTVTGGTETALNMDLEHLLTENAPASITANPADIGDGSADPNEVVVTMLVEGSGTTFRYDPEELTIKVGTTVRWVNRSQPRHTSTADHEWEIPAAPVILPEGAEPWRTTFLREDQSATHTFIVPGMYQYFCETHGPYGMMATITVVP